MTSANTRDLTNHTLTTNVHVTVCALHTSDWDTRASAKLAAACMHMYMLHVNHAHSTYSTGVALFDCMLNKY